MRENGREGEMREKRGKGRGESIRGRVKLGKRGGGEKKEKQEKRSKLRRKDNKGANGEDSKVEKGEGMGRE